MATRLKTATGKEYMVVSGAENINLREAVRGVASRFLVSFKKVGGGTFAVDVVGVAGGYGLPVTDADDIPYQKLDEATPDIAPGTSISAAGNYLILSDGLDVWLQVTSVSTGTVEIYTTPLVG